MNHIDMIAETGQPSSTTVTIVDPLGLHLRKGKDVVREANKYDAQITARNLSRESEVVNVKSILQLMQLQARQGHRLQLWASGPDSNKALQALKRIFETNIETNIGTME